MSGITTHVLDTSRGRPAAGVEVRLERQLQPGIWETVSDRSTDLDGRVKDLLSGPLEAARYQLTFATSAYFEAVQQPCFFPFVTIMFDITDTTSHYHVPLLLSPFGYSTYRGS